MAGSASKIGGNAGNAMEGGKMAEEEIFNIQRSICIFSGEKISMISFQ